MSKDPARTAPAAVRRLLRRSDAGRRPRAALLTVVTATCLAMVASALGAPSAEGHTVGSTVGRTVDGGGERADDTSGAPTLLAPAKVEIGAPVALIAAGRSEVGGDVYAWDTDGNGTFETSTGATPRVITGFVRAVPTRVGVRRTDARGGVTTAFAQVAVVRPQVAKLVLDPPNPQPGEKVHLRVLSRSDLPQHFSAFTWKVEGVKPRQTSVVLGGTVGRGAARSATNRRGRSAAAASVPTSPGGLLDVAGTGRSVTVGPTFTARMPKHPHGAVDVDATAISSSGTTLDLHRSVKVTSLRGSIPDSAYGKKTVDCDKLPPGVPADPCAAIGVGDPTATVPTVLTDASPSIEVCYPTAGQQFPLPKLRLNELKDLAYPPPVDFGQSLSSKGQSQHTLVGRGRPSRRLSLEDGEKKCTTYGPRPVSWNFGDGTGTQYVVPGTDGEVDPYVTHTFAKPGTYVVRLTTKVPYVVAPKGKAGGVVDPEKSGLLKHAYFLATTTLKVDVHEIYCGILHLNGVPVVSEPYQAASQPGTPSSCWAVKKGVNGNTVYSPVEGAAANLDGVRLSGDVVVDQDDATITSPGGTVSGTVAQKVGTTTQTFLVVDHQSVVFVPPATTQPGFGGEQLVALPAVTVAKPTDPANRIGNLPVATRQAFLSASHAAFAQLAVIPPAPLQNNTPPVRIGGGALPAGAAAAASSATRRTDLSGPDDGGGDANGGDCTDDGSDAPPTDFSLDLSGTDVGGFDITCGMIAHRTAGGWQGGADIVADGLGEFDAPYRKPPTSTSTECSKIDGPSGIDLNAGGGFNFGGARLTPDPPIDLGPVSLNCVAISASAAQPPPADGGGLKPFVLAGKAALSVPPAGSADNPGFIHIDSCVTVAVLDAAQTANGCQASLTAPQHLVWIRTSGVATLGGYLPLGDGYLDSRIGSGLETLALHGHFDYDEDIFSLSTTVDGAITLKPKFAFSLIGAAHICADFFFELCGNVQAGVSSRGFGACASFGGFVYYWNGGFHAFFASCDLASKLTVQAKIHALRGSQRAASAATMPANLDQAAFVVHDASGRDDAPPPTLILTRPDGTRILDQGDQNDPDLTILHFPNQGVTSVTIQHPMGGDWSVEDKDGNPIDVQLMTPKVDAAVAGHVMATGAKRTLHYDATLAAGDTATIVEQGTLGTRILGDATQSGSTLTIPTAGTAGKRTVTAIIERDGIPYKTETLGTYQAPALAHLSAPAKVATSVSGGDLKVGWTAVPGATSYLVIATLADGRRIQATTTSPGTTLSGVGRFAAGSVKVVAQGAPGLDSVPQVHALTAVTQVPVHL